MTESVVHSGSRMEAERGAHKALNTRLENRDEALSFAVRRVETRWSKRQGSKLVARIWRFTFLNEEGEELKVSVLTELVGGGWVTSKTRVQQESPQKEGKMKPQLKDRIVVQYRTAEDESEATLGWLRGLAAGRGAEIYADGSMSQPGEPLVLGVDLKSAPYPEVVEGVSSSVWISGPDFLGAPWQHFVDEVNAILAAESTVAAGVERVIVDLSGDYDLLVRWAEAGSWQDPEFWEEGTATRREEFVAWMAENGGDHEYLLIFSLTKANYLRMGRSL